MRNAGYIFLREYLERVRSKTFLVMTVLVPFLIAAVFLLPMYLSTRGSGTHRIAVVDLDGRVAPVLEKRLALRAAPAEQYRLERVRIEPGQETEVRTRLTREIREGRLDGYLWLDAGALREGRADYFARNLADLAGLRALENAVSASIVEARLVERGVPSDQVRQLVRPVRLRTLRVGEGAAREERGASFLMAFFFMMLLYTTLVIYGVSVMRSVIEEKTSRIFEVLLSSVRPMELMAGKILGVAAVGLTQYLVWSVMAAVAGTGGLALVRSQVGEITVPRQVLVFFVIYFVLGYLLYSTLYAALGAAVNTEQEGQQLQLVVVQFLVLPVLVATFVLRSPSSPWAVALSLFPFFTPILMFLRMTVETPPAWQIGLSVALLLAANLVVLWACARVFRIGILMYGKRPTLPELWRWVRTA